MAEKKLTHLEKAVSAMMMVFIEKLKDNDKLTKQQFKELLREELPSFVEQAGDCGDEIFQDVDLDKDGAVDFKEFSMLVASYAWVHFEAIQELIKALDSVE